MVIIKGQTKIRSWPSVGLKLGVIKIKTEASLLRQVEGLLIFWADQHTIMHGSEMTMLFVTYICVSHVSNFHTHSTISKFHIVYVKLKWVLIVMDVFDLWLIYFCKYYSSCQSRLRVWIHESKWQKYFEMWHEYRWIN